MKFMSLTWIKLQYLVYLLLPCLVFSQEIKQDFLSTDAISSAFVGICVRDVESGEILIAHNADKFFIPASTLKLLTGYVALKSLGRQFTFKTQLGYNGIIKNDTLYGNIILIGGGDPTLGSDEFLKSHNLEEVLRIMSDGIAAAGIEYVRGNLVLYNGRYVNYGEKEQWPFCDIGNYYGTSAHSINIHENYYTVEFERSNDIGEATTILNCTPPVDSITWINRVTTAGKWTGDQAYIYGAPFSWERVIRGTIPIGDSHFTIDGSLPFPAYHLGKWLNKALQEQGIILHGRIIVKNTQAPKGYNKLLVLESPPLSEILTELNERSVNLYAEVINKEIGLHCAGIGSTEQGLQCIIKELPFLKDKLHQVDGSGLSPFNGVTPRAYCQFLSHALNDPANSAAFVSTLAVYGRTGTLRYVLNNTALEGKARGKSGSISGVRAYTGMMKAESGRRLVFSFFLNQFYEPWSDVKQEFESLLLQIAAAY